MEVLELESEVLLVEVELSDATLELEGAVLERGSSPQSVKAMISRVPGVTVSTASGLSVHVSLI